MIKIVSKHIVARRSDPLINDWSLDLQENLSGTHPSYRFKYDNNRPKKNQLNNWLSGFGTNERNQNPGAGSSVMEHEKENNGKGVGSGYNDGGQANDETGPGFSPARGGPYDGQKMVNEMVMDQEVSKSDLDKSPPDRIRQQRHLDKLLQNEPVSFRSKQFPVGRN